MTSDEQAVDGAFESRRRRLCINYTGAMTMKDRPTNARDRGARSRFALVHEPDLRECRPRAVWGVRAIRNEMTNVHQIEIKLLTRQGTRDSLLIDSAQRADFDRVRRELEARNGRLPRDKKESLKFVEDLMRAVPVDPIIGCSSPGFRRGATAFIMPYRMYGDTDGFVWDSNAPRDFGELTGNLGDYSRAPFARR
jgi:hypothetical protein